MQKAVLGVRRSMAVSWLVWRFEHRAGGAGCWAGSVGGQEGQVRRLRSMQGLGELEGELEEEQGR